MKRVMGLMVTAAFLVGGCAATGSPVTSSSLSPIAPDQLPAADKAINLDAFPRIAAPQILRDPAMELRVEQLLSRMTVEEKVGQLIQPEILNVTPEDVRKYKLGSVLNGGNGRPDKNPRASAAAWLRLADAYYDASTDRSDGGVGIPIIWGIDSVHGNNSVFGATIFPHNIGLGAANDLALTEKMGRITAIETAAIGLDWTFAPAVSIPRDDRWGRTYEGFSEDPTLAGKLAAAYTRGVQGAPKRGEFFKPGSIIATVKHFVADGGTQNGRDQGDAIISDEELRTIHYPPYIDALDAGAQTVMASYSKLNGTRMHGHGPMLTGLLKQHSGFDGFVIGDFNGHALIPGCTNGNCPQALLAGVDMYMIPVDWKELHGNLMKQVADGTIPKARLDDAVRRILRVKMRAGLFEAGRPSARPFAGQQNIGTAEHRAVARDLARKSMVLLKDDRKLLPFPTNARVLVTGAGADNVSMQVGGWSMNWQGTGLSNADFPGSTSVFAGLSQALAAGGGSAELSNDGNYTTKPDYAVVVFGETPYAEYQGDRETLLYKLPSADRELGLMQKLRAENIPVVAVFLSGRPLWINPYINASDATIAAFLPGTEGGGAIADLLVTGQAGRPRYDFTGRLPFSWPATAADYVLNAGQPGPKPLFPLGYGQSLSRRTALGSLPEETGLSEVELASVRDSTFVREGRALAPWRLYLGDSAEGRLKTEGDRFVVSRTGAIRLESADRRRQEDSKVIEWTGRESANAFVLGYAPINLSDRASAGEAVIVDASVLSLPEGTVSASFGSPNRKTTVDVTQLFAKAPLGTVQTFAIPLSCFAAGKFDRVDMPLMLTSDRPFKIQVDTIRMGKPTGRIHSCT